MFLKQYNIFVDVDHASMDKADNYLKDEKIDEFKKEISKLDDIVTKYYSLPENQKKNSTHHNYATECRILDANKNVIAEGFALTSPVDQFNRRRGFTTAVSRALAKLGYSKADREQIWNILFNGKFSKKDGE